MKSGEKQSIELTWPVSAIAASDRIDVRVAEAAEEPVVVLEPLAAERRGATRIHAT